MYQFKLDGVNVDPWVNRKLNKNIQPAYHKLYDDCINGLEKIFKPYNATMCAHCDEKSKDTDWAYHRKTANKPDCGCCVHCAYNRGYMRKWERNLIERTPIKCDRGVIGSSYLSDCDVTKEGWGYFDPETHSCKLPRHVRSVTCLGYFCMTYKERAKEKREGCHASSMTTRVKRLKAVIADIRETGETSINAEKDAKKTLKSLKVIPWRG